MTEAAPTLHLAPCDGLAGLDWPADLQRTWLVASRGQQVGFERVAEPETWAALLADGWLWTPRKSVWVPATSEGVPEISRQAGLALVGRGGPALDRIAQAWLTYQGAQKRAALQRRLGRPALDPAPCPGAALLGEKAALEVAAVVALVGEVGALLVWRWGDYSFGLHAVVMGDDPRWTQPPGEVQRHPHVRTVPVW